MPDEQRLADLEAAVKKLQDRLDHLSPNPSVAASQADYEEFFGPPDRLEKIEERLEALIQFVSKSHPGLLQTIGKANTSVRTGESLWEQEEIDAVVDSAMNSEDH